MKYALVKDGIVTQCSYNREDGYIDCPDHVCPGYLYGNGEFTAPEIEITTEQKIQQLESERDRLLKGTDWYAVRMLENGTDIPSEISSYRESLRAIDELEGYPDIELPEQPDGIKFVY